MTWRRRPDIALVHDEPDGLRWALMLGASRPIGLSEPAWLLCVCADGSADVEEVVERLRDVVGDRTVIDAGEVFAFVQQLLDVGLLEDAQ